MTLLKVENHNYYGTLTWFTWSSKTPLSNFNSCITLRKNNQFEYKISHNVADENANSNTKRLKIICVSVSKLNILC